jgi:hypothetical protein
MAEEGAPDLQACWSAIPAFDEEEQRIRAAGFDYDSPSDQMKYFEAEIADPQTACGNKIVALYQLTYLQFEHGSAEDYFSALHRTLSDPLYDFPYARVLKEVLVTGGIVYSISENRIQEGYDLLKGEREILETPSHKERSIYAFFLAHAGESQLAESLAKRVFLDAGSQKKLTPAERLVYQGMDPREHAKLSHALRTLMMTGAYDSVVENLARIRIDDSSSEMKLLALSAVPKSADPAAALARLGENVTELQKSEAEGYLSPDASRWYYAAHLLALRASAREMEAEELLAAAQKKFGKSFNAAAEVETKISEAFVLVPNGGVMEVQDTQLAVPIQPSWPLEAPPPATSNCLVRFNVSERGKPVNIRAICDDDRFLKSAENALKRAEFIPRMVDGKPVARYNVVQPLEYRFQQDSSHSRIKPHSSQ